MGEEGGQPVPVLVTAVWMLAIPSDQQQVTVEPCRLQQSASQPLLMQPRKPVPSLPVHGYIDTRAAALSAALFSAAVKGFNFFCFIFFARKSTGPGFDPWPGHLFLTLSLPSCLLQKACLIAGNGVLTSTPTSTPTLTAESASLPSTSAAAQALVSGFLFRTTRTLQVPC